ncbi:MAG: metallophosphoesterase [Gemmatimonadota bacterium]
MRIVHLSDLHLGFRAFPQTEQGWNLRERDVARAFRWALQEVVRLRPAFVLLTGDLFDRPDPPSTAYLALHRGIGVLRSHLPATPILAIAGERDSPLNPADPGPLALLDSIPGVEAAAAAPRAVRFREAGVHALLVPHRAALDRPFPALRPDPEARVNLLLIRGVPGDREDALPVDPSEWSYVAVGGPHRSANWGPNVRAAGAIERPGTNPWNEATEERGFLSFDLDSRRAEFHPVPGRPVVDLAPVRVALGDTEPGTRRLRELLEGTPGGIDGKIVRVRLRGDIVVPEEGIGQGLLLAIRERAAHAEFQSYGEAGVEGRIPGPMIETERILSVPGREAGTGREIHLGAGLVLLTASTEALRRRITRELSAASGTPPREGAAEPSLRLRPDPPDRGRARFLWAGDDSPTGLLRGLLDDPAALGTPIASADGSSAPDVAEVVDPASKGTETALEAGDLPRMERALVELRADALEAAGEVELQLLEWVRNRQEADSRLQAYRERARELRSRIRLVEERGSEEPCPTCGRPLGKHAPRMESVLQDEWEGVVQDGKWWKRRRLQLEEKSEALQEMEEASLRLHARVEDEAERLEGIRERIRHRTEGAGKDIREEGGHTAHGPYPPLESLPGLRGLLRNAGRILGTITEGRLSGIRARGSELMLVDIDGREWMPEGVDQTALRIALHLAIWLDQPVEERPVDVILLRELGEPGGEELAPATLDLIGALTPPGRLVLAVAPPTVLERIPERFSLAIEMTLTPSGRWIPRRLPTGVPALAVAPAAPIG